MRRLALAALTIAACVTPRTQPPPAGWTYALEPPAAGSTVLGVEATFVGAGTPALAIDETAAPLVRGLAVRDGTAWVSAPVRTGDHWLVPGCARACSVRYTVDLAALAAACDDRVDCGLRSRDAILSPALAWLLHPRPRGDVPVEVRIRAPDPSRFFTGLRPAFRSPELVEGSFTAMGAMRRAAVSAPGGTIDVAFLGPPLAMGDDAALAWFADAARCEARLYGRFAVDHAALFVVPMTESDDVLFGKVLALAGPSVVLLVGRDMPAASTRRDGILVHELFHLGFPSLPAEGRWLGEGLATYYEPLLRARCGWIRGTEAWEWLAERLPRGERATAEGWGDDDDLDAVYWGGALFALSADVAIRQRTGGARTLDDWLRAVLARGGDASRLWSVDEAMREGDRATGTDVLSSLRSRVAGGHAPIDARRLLADLGVTPREVRDDAPLAAIRRAIAAN